MAFKLISLRDFLAEVSAAIGTANQRLAHPLPEGDSSDAPPPASGLGIRYVKVNFTARVTSRKLTNAKPVRRDEILLDFSPSPRGGVDNIFAEVLFAGSGEPVDFGPAGCLPGPSPPQPGFALSPDDEDGEYEEYEA